MNYIDHKLSNIVLPKTDEPLGGWALYLKPEIGANFSPTPRGLFVHGAINFFTFFNACSLAKWKKYTGISRVCLHLKFADPFTTEPREIEQISEEGGRLETVDHLCSLRFFGRSYNDACSEPLGQAQPLVRTQGVVRKAGIIEFDVLIPETQQEVVGFTLSAQNKLELLEAYYFAHVAEQQVRPVKLALCTTTFMKENYIQPNIELVKQEILASTEPIAENFHMFVIDNGRTLDAPALTCEGVTVLPNPNVGGSGGFARGMMEALKSETEFTHVLLMDDDVSISTESLKRTYNLLSLTNEQYKNAFINGAMMVLEQPNRLFEDVACVPNSGSYHPVKRGMYFMDKERHVVRNEHVNVEVPQAYGAWWYSCIPVSEIKRVGLPLPLFVRCDDVEYGMRANPTYMTMNGICVWHEGFSGRFRASVDGYQYVRNFLITIAMDNCASEELFMMRIERDVLLHVRAMAYDTADLYLDGLEDYLKGPEYFASLDGETVIKENGKKNEKLTLVDNLEEQYQPAAHDARTIRDMQYASPLLKLVRSLPYNRHLLPDWLLRETPEPILYSGYAAFAPRTAATKTLVALDVDGQHAAVRHMDRERYAQIMGRMAALKAEMKQRGPEVREAYQQAKPYLTSVEFWQQYLGLKEAAPEAEE